MTSPEAKPYGHGPNCTRPEREARLAIVDEMLYRRLLSTAVIERSLAATFGVTERAIRRYIQRVRERHAARAKVDPSPRITREALTEALVDRYNECVRKGDERTALRILQALGDLHGLRVQKHEITGPNGAPLTISPDDAVEHLRRAIERLGPGGGGGGET